MIKVGITGCDNLRAAELVRVLLNHPDVELRWIRGAAPSGTRLDHVIPGIVGECDLTFNPKGELDPVNVLFVCNSRQKLDTTLKALELPETTHVIDLSGRHNLDCGPDLPWTYGMSEMQRRVLVHDAHLVTIPGDAAMASLMALMPMARNLMLNSPITLHVAMGRLAFDDDNKIVDGYDISSWANEQQQEVAYILRQCQSGFDQPVSLTITPLAERRTLAVAARFKCSIDIETIMRLYGQYYNDHNFVFMVNRPILTADVENTNKCLIHIDKDEHSREVTIHAVMDLLLKGSAGNAVHSMNLLFGLQERAGLALKGTGC